MSNKIAEFQRNNGLIADGLLGKMTFTKMKSVWQVNDEQLAHILGQVAHETLNFTKDIENLNYSAKRMLEIFKSDFDTNRDKWLSPAEKEKVKSLIGHPDRIANFVYANQNGNGNEQSGDGWMFIGRGGAHTTGRANYKNFSLHIGEDCIKHPDLVKDKYFFESAVFFFKMNKIIPLCATVDETSITKVSKKVNGGTNGLAERIEQTEKFYKLIKK